MNKLLEMVDYLAEVNVNNVLEIGAFECDSDEAKNILNAWHYRVTKEIEYLAVLREELLQRQGRAKLDDATVGRAMATHLRALQAGKLPSEAWRAALSAVYIEQPASAAVVPDGWMRNPDEVEGLATHLEQVAYRATESGDVDVYDQGCAMAAEVIRKVLQPMIAAAPDRSEVP